MNILGRRGLLYNILAILVYFLSPIVAVIAGIIEGLRTLFWKLPLRAYKRHLICNYLRKQIRLIEKRNKNDKRRN